MHPRKIIFQLFRTSSLTPSYFIAHIHLSTKTHFCSKRRFYIYSMIHNVKEVFFNLTLFSCCILNPIYITAIINLNNNNFFKKLSTVLSLNDMYHHRVSCDCGCECHPFVLGWLTWPWPWNIFPDRECSEASFLPLHPDLDQI